MSSIVQTAGEPYNLRFAVSPVAFIAGRVVPSHDEKGTGYES